MPNFVDDTVVLTLAGEDLVIVQGYEIRMGVLTQPGSFAVRIGNGSTVLEFIERYPPRTPFELRINGALQMKGFSDGYEVTGPNGASEVTIRGRDVLADLHDAYVTADVSYKDTTYADIVIAQLGEVGFTGKLVFDNAANRKVRSGVNVKQVAPPRDSEKEESAPDAQSGPTTKALQAKVGERRYDFCKRILDRAGLFLWATANGDVVLSEPNAKQAPVARLVRQRGQPINAVNILSMRHRNETTRRYSEAVIYGRGGGRVFGRQKSKGKFTDDEMVALGYERPMVHRDSNVTNDQQAEFYARRVLAETRRAGWQLVYTVAGHSIESLAGGRAVWCPDTVADVQDDEIGLHSSLWLESVTFKRDPKTTTELACMRFDDLVFAKGEAE